MNVPMIAWIATKIGDVIGKFKGSSDELKMKQKDILMESVKNNPASPYNFFFRVLVWLFIYETVVVPALSFYAPRFGIDSDKWILHLNGSEYVIQLLLILLGA